MWKWRRSPRVDTEETDGRERGASLPEYALLLCGAFTAISGGADLAAGGINEAFTDAEAGLQSAPSLGDDGGGGGEESDGGGGSGEGGSGDGGSSGGGGSGDGGSGEGEAPPGTGTIGYWKNHPEEWPVTELVIGGTVLSQSELLDILDMSGGNKPGRMAKQLIATELNILAGNDDSCIEGSVAAAHTWLTQYPVGTQGGAVNQAWSSGGDDLKNMLDYYNNGLLACADHRD